MQIGVIAQRLGLPLEESRGGPPAGGGARGPGV